MSPMKARISGLGVLGLLVVTGGIIIAVLVGLRPPRGGDQATEVAPTNAEPPANTANQNVGTPSGTAPVGLSDEVPAPPPSSDDVDQRAKAVLSAGLGASAPGGEGKVGSTIKEHLSSHSTAELNLLGQLGRAGETRPRGVEGLFALLRQGASESALKDYARDNVSGSIAARALVFKWIDRQLGKPPTQLPPPPGKKARGALDLGTVEQKKQQ
jgi:hypothetical protein